MCVQSALRSQSNEYHLRMFKYYPHISCVHVAFNFITNIILKSCVYAVKMWALFQSSCQHGESNQLYIHRFNVCGWYLFITLSHIRTSYWVKTIFHIMHNKQEKRLTKVTTFNTIYGTTKKEEKLSTIIYGIHCDRKHDKYTPKTLFHVLAQQVVG